MTAAEHYDVTPRGLADAMAVGAVPTDDERDRFDLAEQLGSTVRAVQERTRTVFPGPGPGPGPGTRAVSWSAFGTLIPVLAGSAGAGASCVAAAITDALQQAERCTLLVDADDPARSGLACASTHDGPWTRPISDRLAVRYSWRDDALLARLSTGLPTVTPGMVPAPPDWLSDPAPDPLHATVVDLGHGGWRAAANPRQGSGGWLRRGLPSPHPVLVVRATRPSLRQAEQGGRRAVAATGLVGAHPVPAPALTPQRVRPSPRRHVMPMTHLVHDAVAALTAQEPGPFSDIEPTAPPGFQAI
jgi:hypothetical protein